MPPGPAPAHQHPLAAGDPVAGQLGALGADRPELDSLRRHCTPPCRWIDLASARRRSGGRGTPSHRRGADRRARSALAAPAAAATLRELRSTDTDELQPPKTCPTAASRPIASALPPTPTPGCRVAPGPGSPTTRTRPGDRPTTETPPSSPSVSDTPPFPTSPSIHLVFHRPPSPPAHPTSPAATSPLLHCPVRTADHGRTHRVCAWSAVREGPVPALWGEVAAGVGSGVFAAPLRGRLTLLSGRRASSPPSAGRAGRRGPRRRSG